jgi:hypothetical protein
MEELPEHDSPSGIAPTWQLSISEKAPNFNFGGSPRIRVVHVYVRFVYSGEND